MKTIGILQESSGKEMKGEGLENNGLGPAANPISSSKLFEGDLEAGLIGTPEQKKHFKKQWTRLEDLKRKQMLQEFGEVWKTLQGKPSTPTAISTEAVVESLLNRKALKKLKQSSKETYDKRFRYIIDRFPYLPTCTDPISEFLNEFTRETGRHKQTYYDLLKSVFCHAVDYFGLMSNPLKYLDRPGISHKPVMTLSWDEVVALNKTPETDTEKAGLEILLGHGWRPIEARRIKAKDVRKAKNGIICCHGKEREEFTPILPETLIILNALTSDSLPDDSEVLRSRRIRSGGPQPLGEDGFSDLIKGLFARAGIDYKVYDLRKTFGTLVIDSGADYFLGERLLRHKIPGTGDRYIKYSMSKLVKDLLTYSPLRVIPQKPVPPTKAGPEDRVLSADGGICTVDGGVSGGDGGGLNSPSRERLPGYPTSLSGLLSRPQNLNRRSSRGLFADCLKPPYRLLEGSNLTYRHPVPPHQVEEGRMWQLVMPPGRIVFRQLHFASRLTSWGHLGLQPLDSDSLSKPLVPTMF